MFKVLMRGVVNWTSGFGRYLDLALGVALLFIAWQWQQPVTAAFGALGVVSFIADINGRFQRWTMTRLLAKKGIR